MTRSRLWLGVQELVDMRNNIAHGDFAAQATQTDVIRYVQSVITFCERADRVFSRSLGPLCGGASPW
ncbi:MAE_28990/MAE_18760 family HEPN-like nuclease [Mesorhizobium sp. M1312]|uniref:MAE_28990/MAE_18760 family HEPN-like nuclease n=1 Tax=unclassified Mesorhizobium TaxID=325217 RepID=UPI0033371C34